MRPPASRRQAALAAALALAAGTVAAQPLRTAWLWDAADAPAWPNAEAAVVVQHLLLSGERLLARPRLRAPALAPATRVTPVVHVEVSTVQPPVRIERHRDALRDAVLRAAHASSSGWVQLDMEARPSQRGFYLALVRELRAALPRELRLSVTALAWWCRSPAWLDGNAADEVVPMFFRMGADTAALRRLVAQSPQALHPRCRQDAAGFSTREAFDAATTGRYRKTYWFDERRWRAVAPP